MLARLEVFLVTPERELWTGDAEMVIAHGTEGDVGILAGHAPLLIRLALSVVRIQHAGGEERAVVDGGFMHVTTGEGKTRVDVLASHAMLVSEIDVEAERRRKEELERRLRGGEDVELEIAKVDARLNASA